MDLRSELNAAAQAALSAGIEVLAGSAVAETVRREYEGRREEEALFELTCALISPVLLKVCSLVQSCFRHLRQGARTRCLALVEQISRDRYGAPNRRSIRHCCITC